MAFHSQREKMKDDSQSNLPVDRSSHAEGDRRRRQVSIRELLMGVTIAVLLVAQCSTHWRLRKSESELAQLRLTTGYLQPCEPGQIAAVRSPSDQPLTYSMRVRVPSSPKFRVAYSSLWQQGTPAPQWYSAIDLPPGESAVIVRISKDPRDETWKITTLVRSDLGTKRMATVLPEPHVKVFRQTNDVISAGNR